MSRTEERSNVETNTISENTFLFGINSKTSTNQSNLRDGNGRISNGKDWSLMNIFWIVLSRNGLKFSIKISTNWIRILPMKSLRRCFGESVGYWRIFFVRSLDILRVNCRLITLFDSSLLLSSFIPSFICWFRWEIEWWWRRETTEKFNRIQTNGSTTKIRVKNKSSSIKYLIFPLVWKN